MAVREPAALPAAVWNPVRFPSKHRQRAAFECSFHERGSFGVALGRCAFGGPESPSVVGESFIVESAAQANRLAEAVSIIAISQQSTIYMAGFALESG
jgi:hypothetical protein